MPPCEASIRRCNCWYVLKNWLYFGYILTAFAELDTLSEESYKDSTLIMQLLRDNLVSPLQILLFFHSLTNLQLRPSGHLLKPSLQPIAVLHPLSQRKQARHLPPPSLRRLVNKSPKVTLWSEQGGSWMSGKGSQCPENIRMAVKASVARALLLDPYKLKPLQVSGRFSTFWHLSPQLAGTSSLLQH